MNITITARHHELTDSNRALIEEKFSALDKVTASVAGPVSLACEIEESIAVERAGAKYRAEGNLSIGGQLYRAVALNATLEGAVDRVRDELVREVQHAHGKHRNLLRRGSAAIKSMLRLDN